MGQDKPGISVDLISAAKQHLLILGLFYKNRTLLHKSILEKAYKRYTECWLPLYKQHGHDVLHLSPPVDVYFIWYLHMLSTRSYQLDCLQNFGRVLYHEFNCSLEEYRAAANQTKILWQKEFPSVPFEPDLETSCDDDTTISSSTSDSGTDCASTVDDSDIVGLPSFCKLAKQELNFYYDVSLPHYKDKHFLAEAVDRYTKFLATLKCNPINSKPSTADDIPVDVILIWKTHKLFPTSYSKDINPYFENLAPKMGFTVVDVDDIGSDKLFDLEPGTLHRERQPVDHANISCSLEIPRGITEDDTCHIIMDKILVSDLWSSVSQTIIECRHIQDATSIYHKLFEINATPGQVVSAKTNTGLASVDFNCNYHRGFEFHISGKTSYFFCFRPEHQIGSVSFNPRMLFDDGRLRNIKTRMEIPRISCADPKITLNIEVHVPKPKPLTLRLEVSPFSQTQTSFYPTSDDKNNNESFATSLAAHEAALGLDLESSLDLSMDENMLADECISIASHRLVDATGQVDLTCMIRHCHQDGLLAVDARMPAVLLSDQNGQNLAGARFLKPTELPRAHQVSPGCPCQLDPDSGERAMVIFNKTGEWAVCTGRWCQSDENYGYLEAVFCDMDGNNTSISPGKEDNFSLEVGDLQIDFESGKISIAVSCPYPAEHITLSFVISMLYVICQSTYTPGIFNNSKKTLQRSSSISSLYQMLRSPSRTLSKSMSAEYYPILVATGIQLPQKFHRKQTKRDNNFNTIAKQMRRKISTTSRGTLRSSISKSGSLRRSLKDIFIIPNLGQAGSKSDSSDKDCAKDDSKKEYQTLNTNTKNYDSQEQPNEFIFPEMEISRI